MPSFPTSPFRTCHSSGTATLDESGVAGALVGAALMGARVPSSTTEPILLRSGTIDDFAGYAAIGEQQAVFALNARPEWLTQIAPHSLLTSPVESLQMLLERAVRDQRPQNSNTDHPLRIIGDWVEKAPQGRGAQLERRRLLAGVSADYAESAGDPQVALEALCTSMSPKYESASMDAGAGRTLTIGSGLVSRQCLVGLTDLWSSVLKAIPTDGPQDYSIIFEMLHDWAYCWKRLESPPEDIGQLMRMHAARMAKDLAERFSNHSGVLASISQFSRQAELGMEISVPVLFGILYPQEDHSVLATDGMEGLEREGLIWSEKARKLAADLEPLGPRPVLDIVLQVSRQAADVNKTWPDMTSEFAAEIACRTADPYPWAEQAIDSGLTAEVVTPLLRAARTRDRDRAQSIVIRALASEQARGAGISVVLSAEDPTDAELQAVSCVAVQFRAVIGNLVLRRQVSTSNIRWLLRHSSPQVAEAAAANLWRDDRHPRISKDLFEDWQSAMLRGPIENWVVPIVFEAEPWLFAEWLARSLGSDANNMIYHREHDLETAFQNLSAQQRVYILEGMQDGSVCLRSSLVASIVGDDVGVFRQFLTMDNLASVHEAGFAGRVSEEKIRAACDAGWEADRIAAAIVWSGGSGASWSGDESAYWEERRESFGRFSRSEDPRIVAVGIAIHACFQRQIDCAVQRERNRDVYDR